MPYPIPKAAQGINIMDGPLPFLFGMPPEKAVARFKLRLESITARHFDLLAVPRWQQDVANYKWARIRIERKTMLPMAVQMLDTARTRETVYTFPKVEKNPKPSLLARGTLFQKIFGSNDPFRPNLKGYDIQGATRPGANKPGAARPPGNPALQGNRIPSVIGLNYKQAEQVLKARGYTVKFYRGEPAINADLKFKVAKQDPKPREPGENGQLVKVTLFTEPIQQAGAIATKLPAKPVIAAAKTVFAAAKTVFAAAKPRRQWPRQRKQSCGRDDRLLDREDSLRGREDGLRGREDCRRGREGSLRGRQDLRRQPSRPRR